MSRIYRAVILCVVASTVVCAQPQPPKPVKIPKVFREYGKVRVDEYYWMNNPRDSSVIRHLQAENAYTSAVLKRTEGL